MNLDSQVFFMVKLNLYSSTIYADADLGLSLCLFDACPNSVVEMIAVVYQY